MDKTKFKKDIILFVGMVSDHVISVIRKYGEETQQTFRIGLLYDTATHAAEKAMPRNQDIDIVLSCDARSPESIALILEPYQKKLLSVTIRNEQDLVLLKKIRPYIKYAKLPTIESLTWSTDRILMRKKLQNYNRSLIPRYIIVTEINSKVLDEIDGKITFPVVVKPSSPTSGGILMNICYYREELEKVLTTVLKKVKHLNGTMISDKKPEVIVEEFIEGDSYSFDAYISPRGKIHLCPLIEIKTGRSMGFDDFFSYMQITAPNLPSIDIENAQDIATHALKTLSLTSTSAHVELIKTETDWKIVSIGPKMSGWRNDLYALSYGINHIINDILIRIPQKLVFSKRVKQHTAVLRFYAKHEGKLTKLNGIKKIQELESFCRIRVRKQIGDICRFAKNGATPVFDITLSNKDRSKLLADIRRIEKIVEIVTE
ncbi:MAG: ATP-grasp domain-containing protein [bacterium]